MVAYVCSPSTKKPDGKFDAILEKTLPQKMSKTLSQKINKKTTQQ
jgi:hypothetical protein